MRTYRKTERLGVAMSKQHREIIEAKAKKVSMKPSEYLLQMGLTGQIVDLYSEEEKHARRQLIGLSNNLNQLARLAHQVGLAPLVEQLDRQLREIDEILDKHKPW